MHRLKFSMKDDLYAFSNVVGDGQSLRTLAMILARFEHIGTVRIYDINGAPLEDYSDGYKMTPTDKFNEEMRPLLEGQEKRLRAEFERMLKDVQSERET